MKKHNFPFIAVGLGLFLLIVVIKGKETDSEGATLIPLLTLLAINEIAFILNAVGIYFGIKHIREVGFKPINTGMVVSCAILAIVFSILGVDLFPK